MDGVFRYHRSEDVLDGRAGQVVTVPADMLVTMLQKDLHQWFMACFETIQDGPSVRYEWNVEFGPGSWVSDKVEGFLAECGPTRRIVLAAICKYLLLKSTVVAVQRFFLKKSPEGQTILISRRHPNRLLN